MKEMGLPGRQKRSRQGERSKLESMASQKPLEDSSFIHSPKFIKDHLCQPVLGTGTIVVNAKFPDFMLVIF